ncbi:MAG: CaiB/BaiF CoA transferase family protein [Acidimicrobiia bacterium]
MSGTGPAFPLEGFRVLDLSRALSGPYAGRLLADLGADVVKVEPPDGDMTRRLGQVRHGLSGLYTQLNPGKRNVCLDLQTPGGRDLARRLAGAADVVVENFRPGVAHRLGLGWEELSAEHPRLVMLSISGFGQTGPEASRRAFAPVIHAESGLLARQSEADGCGPHDLVLGLADSLAGLHGIVAVLAALLLRDRTGAGQHIDMGMLDAVLATDDYLHQVVDQVPVWPVRGRVWDAPGGPIMIAADPKMIWFELSRHYGLTDPSPAGADVSVKAANRVAVIAAWALAFPSRAELIEALEKAGLAWGEVRTPRNVLESPTVQARAMVADVDDRGGGHRRVVQTPYKFSAAAAGVRGPATYRGEQNREVLAEWLGLDDGEIAALVAGGVLQAEAGP